MTMAAPPRSHFAWPRAADASLVDFPFDRAALDRTRSPQRAAGFRGTGDGRKTDERAPAACRRRDTRGADNLAIPRNRVTLLTDAGIEQFILEDAQPRFIDLELQRSPPRYRD